MSETHLERLVQMCGFHQRAIAFLAADWLDRSRGVDLATAFDRNDARCLAGKGCDK